MGDSHATPITDDFEPNILRETSGALMSNSSMSVRRSNDSGSGHERTDALQPDPDGKSPNTAISHRVGLLDFRSDPR